MFKILTLLVKIIVVSIAVILTVPNNIHANFISGNAQSLSSYEKLFLEERIWDFLGKVDSYNDFEQENIYSQLQERIADTKPNYDPSSRTYIILHIVFEITSLKINTEYSNIQVLNHVLFSQDFPQIEADSDDNSWEIINKPVKIEKEIIREEYNNNRLNEVDKNVVAGESKWVFDLRIRADLEPIESESVEFIFNQNIDDINLRWRIFLDGVLVWDTNDSKTDNNSLVFENLQGFIIPTTTSYLQLELVPSSIGKDEVWQAINNLFITQTRLKDNTWTISWDTISDRIFNENSKNINIVPVDLQVSLIRKFEKNISTASINITPLKWKNNDNGNDFSPMLTSLDIQVSSFQQEWEISVFNSSWILIWSETISASWDYLIPLTADPISNSWEEYSIVTTAEAVFRLDQDSLGYTAWMYNLESKLEKQILLGQR